jgi:hypothetical protein
MGWCKGGGRSSIIGVIVGADGGGVVSAGADDGSVVAAGADD